MNYETFQEHIRDYLSHALGDNATITIGQITKNNHIILDGLTVIEHDCNISPTIYLNEYYANYRAGESLASIQSNILNTYLSNRTRESVNLSFFTEYQNISDKIMFKVVNKKENEELLNEIPHKDYLDLSIVFYCLVSVSTAGRGTILIRNSHLNLWNIDVDELYDKAFYNTPRLLPSDICSMNQLLFGTLEENENTTIPMYVLTNSEKFFGASCVFYPDTLKEFSNSVGQDLCILPSSIHEVILIPVSNIPNVTELNRMVQEVNQTQVDPEEILSDHIYLYSRSRHAVLLPEFNQCSHPSIS